MLAYPRHKFYPQVGEHIDLHDLVSPEIILHEFYGQKRQIIACVFSADVSCGDNQVRSIFGVGHDAPMVIKIVVITLDALDTNNGQTLCQRDAHGAILGLVTFCRIDERTVDQQILDVTGIDIRHFLLEGIKPVAFKNLPDFVGTQETVGGFILNVDRYLGTHWVCVLGMIEGHHGQDQIYGQDQIGHQQQASFQSWVHSVFFVLSRTL